MSSHRLQYTSAVHMFSKKELVNLLLKYGKHMRLFFEMGEGGTLNTVRMCIPLPINVCKSPSREIKTRYAHNTGLKLAGQPTETPAGRELLPATQGILRPRELSHFQVWSLF